MHEMIQRIKKYFENKNEVLAVYLFGSYAHGRPHAGSDVDIAILFDQAAREYYIERRNQYMVELSRILRKDIHPMILNLGSEALFQQIFMKGKLVVVNDEKKHSRHRMVMMSKIAEFSCYKQQMHSGLAKKIMKGDACGR